MGSLLAERCDWLDLWVRTNDVQSLGEQTNCFTDLNTALCHNTGQLIFRSLLLYYANIVSDHTHVCSQISMTLIFFVRLLSLVVQILRYSWMLFAVPTTPTLSKYTAKFLYEANNHRCDSSRRHIGLRIGKRYLNFLNFFRFRHEVDRLELH